MNREWVQDKLQAEYQTKLRVEGAIIALEAMLKEFDNVETTKQSSVDQLTSTLQATTYEKDCDTNTATITCPDQD